MADSPSGRAASAPGARTRRQPGLRHAESQRCGWSYRPGSAARARQVEQGHGGRSRTRGSTSRGTAISRISRGRRAWTVATSRTGWREAVAQTTRTASCSADGNLEAADRHVQWPRSCCARDGVRFNTRTGTSAEQGSTARGPSRRHPGRRWTGQPDIRQRALGDVDRRRRSTEQRSDGSNHVRDGGLRSAFGTRRATSPGGVRASAPRSASRT